MFGGWTVCQGRNARGSIVRVPGRGATFLAALDRDCGAGSLPPPSDPSSMAQYPVAQSRLSDLLLRKMQSARQKQRSNGKTSKFWCRKF
jgi:hypothetical protein